jgi:hypothetical protein
VNTADVIRNLEPYTPLQVRVLCPRGDFIADMTLSVKDGQLAMQGGRSAKDLQRKKIQGKPALYAAVHAAPDWGTVLECVNSHCGYRGRRNSQRLALELAKAALRARLAGQTGHAEYRLID